MRQSHPTAHTRSHATLWRRLILTSVPTFFQMVAKGVLLIAAVIIAEQQARRYG